MAFTSFTQKLAQGISSSPLINPVPFGSSAAGSFEFQPHPIAQRTTAPQTSDSFVTATSPIPTSNYQAPAAPQQGGASAAKTTGTQAGDIAAGYIQGPPPASLGVVGHANDAANAVLSSEDGSKLRTVTGADFVSGSQGNLRDNISQAIQKMLGYSTSPDAQRIAELQKQIGQISGARQSALSQVFNTPGLTSFQNARRQGAIMDANGQLLDPLTSELTALTGKQQAEQQNITQLTQLAKLLAPNSVGSPITDAAGNVTVVNQDPLTGALTTQSLGKIGLSTAPKYTEVSPGATLFDPVTGKAVFRAPPNPSSSGLGGGFSSTDNPLVQAVIAHPESFAGLTPTVKASILPALNQLGFTSFQKLSDAEQKTRDNASSGLGALQTISQELQNGGSLLGAKVGLPSPLKTAMNEAADVITRLRTGAQLNEQEQTFYKGQLPGILDNPDSRTYKLASLRNLFTSLSTGKSLAQIKNDIKAQGSKDDVLVIVKATGQFGLVGPKEFDANLYWKQQ